MSVKEIRKLIEKLEDALDDGETDLNITMDERDDYILQLAEKTEELALMEEELRFLCKLIYDSRMVMPQNGHFTDINPYVSPLDPFRGEYKWE